MQCAAARRKQAAQHAEGGGLAGAVGPEQAEDLAAAHLEVDVVDGGEGAEFLDQLLDLDHRLVPVLRGRVRDRDGLGALAIRMTPAAAS